MLIWMSHSLQRGDVVHDLQHDGHADGYVARHDAEYRYDQRHDVGGHAHGHEVGAERHADAFPGEDEPERRIEEDSEGFAGWLKAHGERHQRRKCA
jgi:hypothetical protein